MSKFKSQKRTLRFDLSEESKAEQQESPDFSARRLAAWLEKSESQQ